MNLVRPRPLWLLALLGASTALLADCGSSGDSALVAAGTGGSYDAGGAGGAADSATCPPGEYICEGNVAHTCDAAEPPVDCAAQGKVCAAGLGCVACAPGSRSCEPSSNQARYCLADGSAELQFECDPVQGMLCAEDGCTGSCAPGKLGRTHVGCDFHPTITANAVWPEWFRFGVLVTNAGLADANIFISRRGEPVAQQALAKDGFAVIELDWVEELKGLKADDKGTVFPPPGGVNVVGGAYRLRSDQPVVVYQFNTLSAENPDGLLSGCPDPLQMNACLSLSNDGSLLLPASSAMTAYTLLGWHVWQIESQTNMPDLVAITAMHDATEVLLKAGKSTVTGLLPGGQPGMQPGDEATFTLAKRGDVLQLFTEPSSSKNQWTGTTIQASRPVQVLSGAPCVNVPGDTVACDHLEEIVPPSDSFGREYVVAAPETAGGARRHIVRLVGLKDATVLTFEPHDVHSAVTLGAQETLEVDTDRDFQVSATKPIGVAHFLVGHGGGAPPLGGVGVGDGDPSQSICVPRSRYLKDYVFATPPGFREQRLNLVAPTGAAVKLNGEAVDPKLFEPVGGSGFGVARVKLQDGMRYELRADQPVGAQLYGYGPFTSFKVPLGLDLRLAPSN